MRRQGWMFFQACTVACCLGNAAVLWAQTAPARVAQRLPATTGASGAAATAPVPPIDTQRWQQVLERLDAAEAELRALRTGDPTSSNPPAGGNAAASPPGGDTRVPGAAGVTPLPSVNETRIHADGNPTSPTQAGRIEALEKKLGGTGAPVFPKVKLSGFFHLDGGAFSQDPASRATLGDIQNGVGFRRARLQAVGSVAEFTNYSLEMDFATAGRPSFQDVWGEQTNIPFFGAIRAGQYRQPTTMDSWTSIRQLTFLERSLPFQAFDPFRRVGVMAYNTTEDQMGMWAYSAFKTGGFANAPVGDSRFATDIGDNGGYAFTGRATRLLYYDDQAKDRYLTHIGGHYTYAMNTGTGAPGSKFYQSRVIPEFFVGDPAAGGLVTAGTPFFADTGRFAANDYNFYSAEFATQAGSAYFQGEYMATTVNQVAGPQVFFDGGYGQVGYFLTGENRSYNKTMGVLDRITPYSDFFALGRRGGFCGWGAWEVAGRLSYVNLADARVIPLPGFTTAGQGRVTNATVGLNWYLNNYTKLQVNYIRSFVDNVATGQSNVSIYAARFQVEF